MTRPVRLFALLLLALACAPAPARAQAPRANAGTIQVSAEILFPPLTATGVRPLAFGTLMPGTTQVTVLPRTPQGGEWRLTGIRNRRQVQISFALPAALTSASGATIPLDFNGAYAGSCEIDAATSACDLPTYQAWNPVTTPVMTDFPERTKPGRPKFTETDYTVYMGGRALVPAAPQAGAYRATITVFVTAN